jgi:hypothetical protein
MPENENEKLIRQYAAGEVTWSTLRTRGFENYLDVPTASIFKTDLIIQRQARKTSRATWNVKVWGQHPNAQTHRQSRQLHASP